MKNKSIWVEDLEIKNANVLNKDIETDILIIGGGITGITTAYYLKDSQYKVTLVEQNYIGLGVTSRTTGKINYLQETIYSDLINKCSFNTAKKYLESQLLAINEINRIVAKEKIDCNLERVESYVIANDKKEVDKLKTQKDFLERNGIKVKEHKKIPFKLKSKYAISVNNTYVFHPLKYLYCLKDICLNNNIEIYEKTKIQKIIKEDNNYICITPKNKINAKKVIFACHYPFFLFPYFIPLKIYTEKSYVTASKINKHYQETYITSNIPCKSVRFHKDKNTYIIYLSNSHNLCNNLDEKNNYIKTIKEAKKLRYNPKYVWSNDDMMTLDKLPYIGYLKNNNKDLIVGTGYNTWGMTNGTLAGYIIKDLILDNYNEFINVFSPLRISLLNNLKSFLKVLGSTIKGFVGNKINKNKKWYSSSVKFLKKNGKNIAIYNDGEKLHIVYNKCPHMGCSLIFNEVEKTWDCPCHASRYDIDGKCIKGPSSYNISYKK